MQILISTFSQGLVWSVLALGVFITFKILNFADMTAEGSLTLGGSICALLITNGVNPLLSLVLAGLISSLAGLLTGLLHTRLKIKPILSGILTMIALYSINIRIMGKANLSLLGKNTIFSDFEKVFPILKENSIFSAFIIGLIICVILIFALNIFFKTQIGLAIRATGDNEQMMRAQGGNTNLKKIIALMISSLLCGLAGGLIAQSQGYSDVNMGTGTIAIALASIVIGESFMTFFKMKNKILSALICTVLGSICYRIIIFIVLNFGMNPSDLKLFTAFVTAILLGLPNIKKLRRQRKMLKLQNISKKFASNSADEKIIFENLNLNIKKGEFVIIVGGNGAGKSTLMNLISGSILPDSGKVFIDEKDVANLPEHKRAKFIGRVFQDPLKGSCPNLTVEENLSLAMLRNKKRTLHFGINKGGRENLKHELEKLNLGLENRLDAKMGTLSGGQRQAITLLMATLVKPKILLLDEHTAALDPKSSEKVLNLTQKIISDNSITTLMITHNLNHAMKLGNRLIVLNSGKIKHDVSGKNKEFLLENKILNVFQD